LKLITASRKKWGVAIILATGSDEHVRRLQTYSPNWDAIAQSANSYLTESSVYAAIGLTFIPPELREGCDEIALAANRDVPVLVSAEDICGELHAHSTSSDGSDTIEEMAIAAKERGTSTSA
jgi:DNA polymerase (family X)